ncbi:hypothetical protein NIES4074_35070 [Cylindrospermum sp. NIES-4074]|nr:hypothetical protein NIES4074_35070 [Cylindrospermum sp. NIES-4074]
MSQQNFWESLTKSAADFGKTIADSATQATQAVTDTAAKAGETVGNATAQASKAAAEAATNIGGSVSSAVSQSSATVAKTFINVGSAANQAIRNWVCFSENDSLAFYGVLFAVAAADGSIDAEELNLIFSSPDISNMSKSAKQQIQNYSVSPPNLEEALKKLATADEKLRFGLMFYILNIVWVDKVLNAGEEKAIELAQKELGIATEQVKAIDAFVQKMGEIRERGLNDDYAINSIKEATARLKKVGVPIESFSTSEEGSDLYNLSMTYSDEVFWEKLGGLALQAGKTVVESALTLYYVSQDPKVPAKEILLIGGTLAYFILPIDGVPDLIPGVGFTDDLAVLTAAVGTVAMCTNVDEAKEAARQKMGEWFGDI